MNTPYIDSNFIETLTSLTLVNDKPRLPNTAPIHPVLRNVIPGFQDLYTDFLPWLFQKDKTTLLKEGVNNIVLTWEKLTFNTDDDRTTVLQQATSKSWINFMNLEYSIQEGNEKKIGYNIQIPIPIICAYGETDPWGLKNIAPRPYTLGGYVLTGKGLQKYPISIEHDRYYFGTAKKKALSTNSPQFAFSIDKEMIHPSDKGQTPQHFKIVMKYNTLDLNISCNNTHSDLKLPEVNIISLCAYLTNRTIQEVGASLKLLDYSGEKTVEIHAAIDGLIDRAEAVHPELVDKIDNPQVLSNLMSQYQILTPGYNKRKGYMLEVQIRRMLMSLFAPNFYPDRDSLQRKRYISCGNYYAQIFMSKVIDICNIKNNTKLNEKTKIVREVEKLLSSIISTINTDISTGTYDKKTGVWVHDASTSTINNISKLTVCSKKLMKEITKDLTFRYFHTSQTYSHCAYDVPEHGENVGLVNSTTILSRLTHIYPAKKLKLVMELFKTISKYQQNCMKKYNSSKDISSYEYHVLIDDLHVGRFSAEDALTLYYDLRFQKRAGQYTTKDFGVVYDPYLNELRVNVATGRIVQPILVLTDGVLELEKISGSEMFEFLETKPNLDEFMDQFPHVLEYIDCDTLQVSSRRDGRLLASIDVYHKSDIATRKLSDYCMLASWGYLGWVINHIPFRDRDEAIRSVFYCSLSKSGIHNKILVKNVFETYHRTLYTILPLYTNPVIESTEMGRLAYCEAVLTALIPAQCGLNQEDGSIINRDSRDVGMLQTIRVIKYKFNIEKTARQVSTNRVVKHGNQDNIDPVNGLPILNSVLKKGDTIVRNYTPISTSSTGISHIDNSERYNEHTPARVEKVIVNNNSVSILLVTNNPIMNGDKISTLSAQKSTAVAIVDKSQLPCTMDGLYPNIIMSPTGPLTRKTPSTVVSTMPMLNAVLEWINNKDPADRIQVRLTAIEETFNWIEAVDKLTRSYDTLKKTYGAHDPWRNQSSKDLALMNHVAIHPHTNEIMKDVCMGMIHYYRSKHIANLKKNVCNVGRTSIETGQNTGKRKSGGAPKFDEMSRTVCICYGAAYTLWDLLSDPNDRKQFLHICVNCSMYANYESNKDESYYYCYVCLNKYGYSKVIKIEQTYAAKKFFEYCRARGVSLQLHPSQESKILYKYM